MITFVRTRTRHMFNPIPNKSFINKCLRHIVPSSVLIFFTILALIFANVPLLKGWYNSLWELPVSLTVGSFNLFGHGGHPLTLGDFVNDFLMAIFFLAVGLEIKREVKNGELSTKEKALLPVIGAFGGMIVPVLLFALICPGDAVAVRGMAIPMATDIAFSLGILAVFRTRVPLGLKIFLAALAVADDLGGILVIAVCYASEIDMMYLLYSGICVGVMILGNVLGCHRKRFYQAAGMVLWYLLLNSGVHATIAGVITAFCVPATRPKESTEDSPLQILEHHLYFSINYVIIPVFAFANAGIDLSQMTFGSLFSGVGLAVIAGLVAGKFIGVFSFSWLAVRMKIVMLPAGADWKSFAAVCVVCGIGFTVSMFIADLSYSGVGAEGAALLSQAKLGVLCGSTISAVLGCVLLNRFLPGGGNHASNE